LLPDNVSFEDRENSKHVYGCCGFGGMLNLPMVDEVCLFAGCSFGMVMEDLRFFLLCSLF
jgi:Fe-S oxidoreductase